MIIQQIESNGIKDLYEYFFRLYGADGKEHEKRFVDKGEERSVKLLETITVFLRIEDLTAFEVFVLQNYLPKESVSINSSIVIEKPDLGNQPPELFTKRQTLYGQIFDDQDVSTMLIDILRYPYAHRFSCQIFLTGKSLMEVTGVSSAFNLLISWLGDTIHKVYKNDNGGVDHVSCVFPNPNTIFGENAIIETNFDDFVASKFFQSFYKYYLKFFTERDLIADAYRYDIYFESIRYNECVWIDILTPVATIHMSGDDKLNEKMNDIKGWYHDRLISGNHPDENIKLTITTKISLITFLLINREFPGLISDWMDLMILFNDDMIHIVDVPGYNNYKVRIRQYLDLLDDTRTSMQKNNFIESTNFISYGTPISCLIKGSLKDLNDFFTWIDKYVDGKDNEFLEIRELKNLKKNMFLFTNTLHTLINTPFS